MVIENKYTIRSNHRLLKKVSFSWSTEAKKGEEILAQENGETVHVVPTDDNRVNTRRARKPAHQTYRKEEINNANLTHEIIPAILKRTVVWRENGK